MSTHLRLDDISVRYRSAGGGVFDALSSVTLDVAEAEVLAVVGPSGCGKSTLLRAVAGIEPLQTGRVVLAGRDLDGVPTHRRDLGLMFQDHALFPHLSVAGNIAFGLRMQGIDRAEQDLRVLELLELVGLQDFGDRRIDQLSGGEAQRVALARALAPSPGLLMLDEPLGSLDRVLREQLTGDLRRLATELGLSAIHVTHDQAEAFALADRIVVLDGGRVQQVGTPAELWNEPASAFIAEFLGHPNLWVRPDGVLLVPIPALSVHDRGERSAVIELVEFYEGRHRVTARTTDAHVGEKLVFESVERMAVGAEVKLRIDPDQTRLLPGRDRAELDQ